MLNGSLFTRDFLTEGIRDTTAWMALDEATVATVRTRLAALLAAFGRLKNPTEAETEKELIWPILEAVDWTDMSVQPNLSAKARYDVPDALLYADANAKAKGAPLSPWQRFQHGVCVVEAKRWNRVLDREEAHLKGEAGVPSTQMLRYLRRVDDVTKGGLRWGMLTNGRHWRLYFRGALSVAEDFLEIDLGKVFDLPGCETDLLDKRPDVFVDDASWRAHALKLFVLLFGREAFLPIHRGETFHQLALREGKQWEARVARDLSDTVFDYVFPALAQALAVADGRPVAALDAAALEEVREGALILLYRLLFVLYAEDRNLLPDESGPYADYSLTKLRGEVAERKSRGAPFSDRVKGYWSRLDGVFRAIGQGDDGLGIPPYNGGLFDPAAAPILARIQLPDTVVAEIVFRLSHIDIGDGRPPKYINYRDLSVQQLGSVYERILEHGLKVEEGRVVVAENPGAEELGQLLHAGGAGSAHYRARRRPGGFRTRWSVRGESGGARERHPRKGRPPCRPSAARSCKPAPRSQDLRSGHGLRSFPCQPRRLAGRSRARRHGRGIRGRQLRCLCFSADGPDRSDPGKDSRGGENPRLADRRVAARRPPHRPSHGAQARRLWRRQEPHGGRAG